MMLTRRSVIGGIAFLPLFGGAARIAFANQAIKIREIFAGRGEFSDMALGLDGEDVTIAGFMAPPLKPDAAFFVLTRRPMAVCPFCDNEADWPRDIVLVKMNDTIEWLSPSTTIEVTGTLSLGTEVDEETGFVSRVRVVDAEVEQA